MPIPVAVLLAICGMSGWSIVYCSLVRRINGFTTNNAVTVMVVGAARVKLGGGPSLGAPPVRSAIFVQTAERGRSANDQLGHKPDGDEQQTSSGTNPGGRTLDGNTGFPMPQAIHRADDPQADDPIRCCGRQRNRVKRQHGGSGRGNPWRNERIRIYLRRGPCAMEGGISVTRCPWAAARTPRKRCSSP